MLFAETDDLISIPGIHKERMDSKLSSDLHTHVLGLWKSPKQLNLIFFFKVGIKYVVSVWLLFLIAGIYSVEYSCSAIRSS